MFAILAIIYIVFISLGLPDSLFGAAWPVVHLEFGVAESYASLYSIVTGLCSGGASFLAGVVLRKFGTARVTFASILLTVIGLIGMSFSPNIYVMMFFAVVLGLGAGAIDTGLNNYVSLHYKARHMSWLHCMWGIGVTVSPLILSLFIGENSNGSWRDGYRTVAFIQLAIAILVFFFLKKWRGEEQKLAETASEEKPKEKFNPFKSKGLIISVLSLGFYCSMEFTTGTFGASYLVNVFFLTPDSAARWISFYFLGITLGRLVSGFASMKLSDAQLVRSGAMFSLLGMLMLILPIGKIALLGLLLIGFGFGPVFPSVLHAVPSRFGKTYSSDITGFHMGGAYAIGFFNQLIFGLAAPHFKFSITPFVLTAFCALTLICNETVVKKLKVK